MDVDVWLQMQQIPKILLSFLPLAWILLTPKNADERHLSRKATHNAAKGKVAIVNPARERTSEKL